MNPSGNGSTFLSILSNVSNSLAPERFGPLISRRVGWRVKTESRRVALTFDDGPHERNTPQLLEILDRFAVPATFFLIGKHIEKNLALAKETVQAGHELANHTYTHPLMVRLKDSEMQEEIRRTDELLADFRESHQRFLRPPMGLFSKKVLDSVESAGYQTVIGDVYPRDPHLPGKEKILDRILRRVKKGSIIILHDGGNSDTCDRSQTFWAVKQMIPILRDRGFEFCGLSELFSESSAAAGTITAVNNPG